MDNLNEYFYIKLSSDQMSAVLYCTDSYKNELEINETNLKQFLQKNKVNYGIKQDIIKQVLTNFSFENFPLTIAHGTLPVNGIDGKITYELKYTNEIDRTSEWDFRDVMHIPSVKKGQKLAILTMPTEGKEGINVGKVKVPAIKGKPVSKKAGKNVVYNEKDQSFYAASDGQLSVSGNYIQVQPVFEVDETLSMKNGNLNFTGTIIVHGDIPAGYTVKADGDIKIHGMVEAATVIAGGSIYISEGVAGQKKGYIRANENINIGYINQGNVFAGNDLYVENSILHSECTAVNHVFCQQGNIIGGSLSAGKSVEAKDIGNRMSTKTEIIFGVDNTIDKKEKSLLTKKEELRSTLEKLAILGEKLHTQDLSNNPRLRITVLKQKNSLNKTKEQLEKIDFMLEEMNSAIGSETEARLVVRNNIYQSVVVTFGKYKRIMNTNHHYVQIKLSHNEIVIHSI
ncbi:DUF342 domain-containing protein [Virgibacillus profundi]|nr:FapA family protein [Virgibacillus profundi]